MPLVLVPTPLGNLGDITLRAIEALRDAELIVAEDTRVTRKLLGALEIATKELWSYREANAAAVTAGILERARAQRVAVVTDAGMPAISDPGSELIAAARAAGVAVDVLPGPSAVLGALVLSGFSLRRFAFEGFPARATGARREQFAAALRSGVTTAWYESPQRIVQSLADLHSLAPDAKVFVVREYTKRFEQQLLGTPAEVAAALADPVRGEIAFVLAPYTGAARELPPPDLDAAIDERLERGESVAEIARALARIGAGARRDLYARATERKAKRRG
ncbi:MAG TPA: 16S rRNA (cytidine(1402)-2'-O)-methyltransferase [Candidatus Baltobacteraceae bacterium]|nr:16S rRNA (cytidine(1402)-2'-O)-methyltransferase [Candidatus Baltobacteraceae bacterium]